MVEIGGRPILWHIMNIYAAHGFHEFVVALGYKGEVIKDYFLNFHTRERGSDRPTRPGRASSVHDERSARLDVHLVDTGADTQTGGRLRRLRAVARRRPDFMMTYGDGVGEHRHRGAARLPPLARQAGDRHGRAAAGALRRSRASTAIACASFAEKPQTGEGWINGGFFVLERAVLDYIAGDQTLCEREPLETLAREAS